MNGVIAMKVHFLPLRHVLCDSGLVASLHNTSPVQATQEDSVGRLRKRHPTSKLMS